MKGYKKFYVDGSKKIDIDKFVTSEKIDKKEKEKYIAETEKNQLKIAELQDKLYADGREGLIIVLQAMDAAGKDSTVKNVMSGINPQGVNVYSFKAPSSVEMAHDFLWRIESCVPERGKISIFNRSQYEDVLVVKVHDMYKNYKMPERCIKKKKDEFFSERYEDILNYEKYLYHNGYRIIKIFLNVSKDEQKKRFLERIDRPEKNWKFSSSDIKERALWDEYHKAYQDAINATSSKNTPWYVLPADQKWFTRYLVSEIIKDTLRDMDPKYPDVSDEQKANLAVCKVQLESEGKK
jgi:PPK2 family polyphosphate:nucleotide phosphotransferase